MRRAAAIAWALLAAAALAPAAAAAPGDLDGSFSGDGWVRTLEVRSPDNNYLPRGAEDVAIQPDGRIVAVGEMIDGVSNWYFGAFRHLPNGELDPSFGEGGWIDTDVGSFDFPHAVAIQRDGGIVVAGEGDCQYAACFVVARYRPDGSLDPGFGAGGIVRTSFGLVHAARPFDVTIAPDGRIVAAGFVMTGGDGNDSSRFAVARYLPDGRLDQSFSRDGRATVDFGTAPISRTPSPPSAAAGSSWPATAPAASTAPSTTSRSRASGATAGSTARSQATGGERSTSAGGDSTSRTGWPLGAARSSRREARSPAQSGRRPWRWPA